MMIYLIIKKFPTVERNCFEQNEYASLCSYEKNYSFRYKLFKKPKPRKRILRAFKKNWFCYNCSNVFSLKPLKKYKTLLHFRLQCPKCKSEKIVQNIYKKTVEELLKFSWENKIEVEQKIKNIKKYHLQISSNNNLSPSLELVISLF